MAGPGFLVLRAIRPAGKLRHGKNGRWAENAVTLTIYHNPRCTKSRETLALIESRGLKARIIEYLKTPPSAAEIKKVVKMLGLPAHALVRKAEAAAAGIDPGSMNETALIAAMAKNPIIIERPIVVNNGKAALGRPPANVLKIL